jgi:hypothetical protein
MPWNKLFRYSRWVHKYVGLAGLFILAYFLLMGISGVLLNHPGMISRCSVPVSWLPTSYQYHNWNRMAVRDVVFSTMNPAELYVGGREGVWASSDGGAHFRRLERGFPASSYRQDTEALLLIEDGGRRRLFAGTHAGLYFCDPDENDPIWRPVAAKALREEVVSLLRVEKRIFAFTPSHCYTADSSDPEPRFLLQELAPPAAHESTVSMFLFLLRLHDGSLFGWPGRIFVDIVGLALVFLSVSAFYLWYAPWRNRTFPARRKKARYYRFFYDYHLKIGIYGAFFILVVVLTGMLIWQPLYPLIMRQSLPASFSLAADATNPWQDKISKAAYLAEDKKLLLATRDGLFVGSLNGSGVFELLTTKLPVHQTTVLKPLSGKRLLAASFTNGIYVWERDSDKVVKLHQGRGRTMVSAAAVRDGEPLFWTSHDQGLVPLGAMSDLPFRMPAELAQQGRVSLWNFLLNLHNARLFRDLVGYHWWIVQIGGLLLLLTTLSGTYDWLFRKGVFRNKPGSVGIQDKDKAPGTGQ